MPALIYKIQFPKCTCIFSFFHNYSFASCLLRNSKTNHRIQISLHYDIVSTETTAFLSRQNIDLTSHTRFNPDLSPNDFFLFPYVKTKLRGQRFSIPEKAVDAFRTQVLEKPQSEFPKRIFCKTINRFRCSIIVFVL